MLRIVVSEDYMLCHDLSRLPTGESMEVQDNHGETHRRFRSQMDQLFHDILTRGIGGAFTTNLIREPLLTIGIKGGGTIADTTISDRVLRSIRGHTNIFIMAAPSSLRTGHRSPTDW